jgi:hypothetical protein
MEERVASGSPAILNRQLRFLRHPWAMTSARKSPPLREILRDPRLALMLTLGFSSGLPFLLIFSTQSAWLREAGVSRSRSGS